MIFRLYERDFGEKIRMILKENKAMDKGMTEEEKLKYQKLVSKHLKNPFDLLVDARKNFEKILHSGILFAKRHMAYIKAEISLEKLTSCIFLTLDRFFLLKEDLDFIKDIFDLGARAQFESVNGTVEIKITIPFFATKQSPMILALNEMYQDE